MSEADQGYVWAVDMDLEKFFDTVNHSRLIRKLSTRIKDGRVISLITRMLKSGVWTQGKVEKSEVGLMQVNFYVYRDLVLRTWKQRLLHALKRMFTALCQQKSSATELTKI